jgi:hypothetical protein
MERPNKLRIGKRLGRWGVKYRRNNKDFVSEIGVFQNSCLEHRFLRIIHRLKGTLTYIREERMIMNSKDARKEVMH